MKVLDTIRIGNLTAEFDGKQLTLFPPGNAESVSLHVSEVYELFDFINGFHIPEVNTRMAFRVPNFAESSLRVQIGVDLKIFETTPVNISMNGILLSFPSEQPELEIGQPVSLVLSSDSTRLKIHGEVRSTRGKNFGIFFPETVKGKELNPPHELAELVMKLQREWLAHRKAKKNPAT
jgi:hypothetical protein